MAFNETSTIVKVALVCSCLGLLLHIVGIATENWISYNSAFGEVHWGIWLRCPRSGCADFILATRAFGVIGCLVGIATICLILFGIFRSSSKVIQVLAFLICGGAAACILLCVIIFGSKIHDYYDTLDAFGWSFGLCCSGGVLFCIAAILLLVQLICK